MKHWTLDGTSLMLDGSDVDSSTVFNAMGYGDCETPDVECPQVDLPFLTFSRRGIRVCFVVSLCEANTFVLRPALKKLGREISAPHLPVPLPGHLVIDNVWYFLDDGAQAANDALKQAGVTSFGSITLSQYFRLVALHDDGFAPEINSDLLENVSDLCSKFVPPSLPLLNAKLYPYQEIGYRWLCFMAEQAHGCLLGDEMGLGKTLQVIAFLLGRDGSLRDTSLVIAPVSLLENWRREINRFAPTLNVFIHHGPSRPGLAAYLKNYDVVIMSYGAAVTDLGMLASSTWDVLVLDEAQAIKNPDSRRSGAVKAIPHRFGIAVSGTPFENHILDVWSILNFAEPDLLGDRGSFSEEYPDDLDGAARLEKAISPFILHRSVFEVANDLPEKIEIPVPLTLLDSEAEEYERVRQSVIERVGLEAATLVSLNTLRMFCAHPACLVDDFEGLRNSFDPSQDSSKYQYLCTLIQEIVARGEKVLVFTSYRKMIEILCSDISKRFGIETFSIDGSTPPQERQGVVDSFTATMGSSALILNPSAAGTGLNITAACNVIHYNLEWNPAKEDQATARAYRRGQVNAVRVYKLFYSNTVEESVYERMNDKRAMADSAIIGTQGKQLDRDAIVRALSLSPVRSTND